MSDGREGAEPLIAPTDLVLVTGAAGFIGRRVVEDLLRRGFSRVRCLVRLAGNAGALHEIATRYPSARIEIVEGNLLSPDACRRAVDGVSLIYHLVAGMDKSFAGAFMNSVLTTRNMLAAMIATAGVRRFVNVSSFAVYSGARLSSGDVLDEGTSIEADPAARGDAYAYGKIRQDELVLEYARAHRLPIAIVRPGAVFGPGRASITGRVGIDTFGVYLHLGGSNKVPLTYVDNCAAAIVLAGLRPEAEGQVFNVVDDDLPTSRAFLRGYKRHARAFRSLYVPYPLTYGFCWLWEKYSRRSYGQLPPTFTTRRAQAEWKRKEFSNRKLKTLLGWRPEVSMREALDHYYADARAEAQKAEHA